MNKKLSDADVRELKPSAEFIMNARELEQKFREIPSKKEVSDTWIQLLKN